MHKKQLQAIKHHVEAALLELNWQGKFTKEIRDATVKERLKTVDHLLFASRELDVELRRCEGKIEKRRAAKAPREYRLPYKD